MSQQRSTAQPPGLNVQDILYILFKHKWKVLLCAAAGICAAAVLYFLRTPIFESEAKLLVRYVVDTSAIDQVESRATIGSSSENLINSEVEILTSWDLAMQVAKAVGPARLLPKSEDATDLAKAARTIRLQTMVTALRGTNIIMVAYKNPDPELASLVLKELISRYFTKHLEVHRSADAFNFVAQQSDEVRARLNQTEQELKQLKGEAGITSLSESLTNLSVSLKKTRDELQASEAELAEQRAAVQEMEKAVAAREAKLPTVPAPDENAETIQQYNSLLDRLRKLRETQIGLLFKYHEKPDPPSTERLEGMRQMRSDSSATPNRLTGLAPIVRERFIGAERDTAEALARERYRRQNDTGFAYRGNKKNYDTLVKEAEQEILGKKNLPVQEAKESQAELVKLNHIQIENLEKQRLELERKFPGIAESVPISSENPRADISSERARLVVDRSKLEVDRARLAGIEARREALKSRLSDLLSQMALLSNIGPRVEQLQRTKEIEENNYKYFQASLEKARVDEALDPSKMPNISIVQSPSTAFKVTGTMKKIVLGLAGGGIALGIGLAFLIELILNRTVNRPLELETLLGIPLWLSIPYLNGHNSLHLNGKGRLCLRWPRSKDRWLATHQENGDEQAAPWEFDHPIRGFAETIRDRLILSFELNRVNHKPKLVAVTGCPEGAGTSTISAGIAAALSETGDGKVLLVDMNVGRPEVHPFFQGAPACSLAEALVGAPAPAGENLYLAVATPADGRRSQVIPKRFYDMMPHLKASEFDYIIFDMPPLSQTSVTLAMSGWMDKVLVVVEAERTHRDFVKRTYLDLLACRANASVIFNKVRSYTPKWLGVET